MKLTDVQRKWIEDRLFPENHYPPGKTFMMHFADHPIGLELRAAGFVEAIRYGTDTWWVEITDAGRQALIVTTLRAFLAQQPDAETAL